MRPLAWGLGSLALGSVLYEPVRNALWRLGNPLTTSNDAPDKSRMRFLGVSGGIFLKMLFWKIYGFSKITFTSINVLKKTFSRSWSRYRLSHTLHCIFADGK